MSDPQEYDNEHSSANTYLTTNLHGRVKDFISIDPPTNKASSTPIYLPGSMAEVGRSAPVVENLPLLVMKIRRSGIKAWEERIRDKLGLAPKADLLALAVALRIQLISEPFRKGDPLPTVVKTFMARYAGSSGGSDRKSNDPLEEEIYLQQTSPSRTT